MIISDSNISMSSGRAFTQVQRTKLEFDGANSSLFTSYLEKESTSFQSQGQVNTTDGRNIDLDISLFMQRSEEKVTGQRTLSPVLGRGGVLVDPLVINTGFGITKISDKKFLFDLDSDGREDNISTLGRGSGFLVYDKNEDGIINNGLELFGAVTGDGFGELAEYDYDKNGWIDEADEVFSKLKVWFKNEDGTDELVSLKDAGIGAIYLGNAATEFSEKGAEGLNGVIRSTGFFLGEDGSVGTIMHIDLVAETPASQMPSDFSIDSASEDFGTLTIAKEGSPAVLGVKFGKGKREIVDYIERLRAERKKMLEQQLAKTKEKRKERADFYRDLIMKRYEDNIRSA